MSVPLRFGDLPDESLALARMHLDAVERERDALAALAFAHDFLCRRVRQKTPGFSGRPLVARPRHPACRGRSLTGSSSIRRQRDDVLAIRAAAHPPPCGEGLGVGILLASKKIASPQRCAVLSTSVFQKRMTR